MLDTLVHSQLTVSTITILSITTVFEVSIYSETCLYRSAPSMGIFDRYKENRYIKENFICKNPLCKNPFLKILAVIEKTGITGGRYKQVSLYPF